MSISAATGLRRFAHVSLFALGLSPLSLMAATPDSGTLTEDGETIEYTGGPFAAANVFAQEGDPQCYEPAFPCDDFALTVDLSEDFIKRHPSALVRIVTWVDDPGADVREDFDLYLYDANGTIVGESESESDPEAIGFLAPVGPTEYTIRIVPFTAFASTHRTTVELIPGEPVEVEEDEDTEGEGLISGLKSGDSQSTQPLAAAGAGSLGMFGLSFLLLGLRRKRS